MTDVGHDAFSELLYPMLRDRPRAAPSLVDELASAPLEKAAETNRLRRQLLEDEARILECAALVAADLARGGRLFACGNGGSATTAADLVGDLGTGGGARPPLPALSLTADVAVVTAIANDVSFADVFTRQLIALGRRGDVVVAISTSGGSENLVRALGRAGAAGMRTIAITGNDGGRIAAEVSCDHLFVIRSSSVHRIQEVQTSLCHLLVELVRHHMEERACA